MQFFFNDTATTEIYTLSLHDALPISCEADLVAARVGGKAARGLRHRFSQSGRKGPGRRSGVLSVDRKSTRLNSSHAHISYAVFCLKKKKTEPCGRDPRRS